MKARSAILLLIDEGGATSRWEACARTAGMVCRRMPAPPRLNVSALGSAPLVVVHAAGAFQPLFAALRAAIPGARIVASGTDPTHSRAVEAFRAGALDFILDQAGDAERLTLLQAHAGGSPDEPEEALAGDSVAMRRTRALIRKLAPVDVVVLLTGETGTGKDVAAAMLHRHSRRAKGPIVALNCAAIPDALLEGELFGYERGAFSGAAQAYPGKLKLADGGTLFLDEVAELSLTAQSKVLRAIEAREAWRLGGRAAAHFDIRIVAATNRDLAKERAAGRFRDDLYFRLAVAQVHLPPLRHRPEDILPIARVLLRDLAAANHRLPPPIGSEALAVLRARDWNGNVRELRNVLEVALIEADFGPIGVAHLTPAHDRIMAAPEDERASLIDALDRNGGNKSLAARSLGCSRMTLYRKIARYDLCDKLLH